MLPARTRSQSPTHASNLLRGFSETQLQVPTLGRFDAGGNLGDCVASSVQVLVGLVALDVAIDVVVDVGSKASNELGVGLEGEALPPDPQPNLCEQEAQGNENEIAMAANRAVLFEWIHSFWYPVYRLRNRPAAP
jgi:hypothetical protein